MSGEFKSARTVVQGSMSRAAGDQSRWRAPSSDVAAVVIQLTPETRALLQRAVRKQQNRARLDYGLSEAAQDILAWVARTEAARRAE